MTFTATKKQYNLLESLAYWRAELEYNEQKTPDDVAFSDKCRKTIEFLFPLLDAEKVPFWVQNAALAIGENWREYENHYFSGLMKKRGITKMEG